MSKEKSSANIPEFLALAGLVDGEVTPLPKPTALALASPGIFPLKINVFGVVICQTHGYASELAVVQRRLAKGENPAKLKNFVKVIPGRSKDDLGTVLQILTMAGLASKVRLAGLEAWRRAKYTPTEEDLESLNKSKENLRRAVSDLEADGLLERARIDCPMSQLFVPSSRKGSHGGPLAPVFIGYELGVKKHLLAPFSTLTVQERKRLGGEGGKKKGDRIGLFLLAKPNPANSFKTRDLQKQVDNTDYLFSLDLLKTGRLGTALQESFNFTRSPNMRRLVAKASNEAPEQVQKALQEYKDTIDESNRRLHDALAVIAANSDLTSAIQLSDEIGQLKQPISTPLNPNGHGAIPRTRQTGSSADRGVESPPVSQPGIPVPEAEAYQLLDVLQAYGIGADLEGCLTIVQRCREARPSCTAVSICAEAQALATIARKKDDAFAWLIWKLPMQLVADPDRKVERMVPDGFGGLRPGATPETLTDWPDEPEGVAELKAELRRIDAREASAGKDLKNAGTSSIAIEKANAKIARVEVDRLNVEGRIEALRAKKRTGSERPERVDAAGAGD